MVAAYPDNTRMVEAITVEEAAYEWHCETCGRAGRLMQIQRSPEDRTTRFIILCASGVMTNVDMTYEYRMHRSPIETFRHQRQPVAAMAEIGNDIQLRCLTGCGEVYGVESRDQNRDGVIIHLICTVDLNIFVSEQIWRAGISRLSYRHDGNYVIFGNDGRLVSEGRAEPVFQERPFDPTIRVMGTNSAIGLLTPYEQQIRARVAQLREEEEQVRRQNETLRRIRESENADRSPTQDIIDRLRENFVRQERERQEVRGRQDRAPRPLTPEQEMWRNYWAANSVVPLPEWIKPQEKKPEPRPRRVVIRRALEKKDV
jgi:hypothetical protein